MQLEVLSSKLTRARERFGPSDSLALSNVAPLGPDKWQTWIWSMAWRGPKQTGADVWGPLPRTLAVTLRRGSIGGLLWSGLLVQTVARKGKTTLLLFHPPVSGRWPVLWPKAVGVLGVELWTRMGCPTCVPHTILTTAAQGCTLKRTETDSTTHFLPYFYLICGNCAFFRMALWICGK